MIDISHAFVDLFIFRGFSSYLFYFKQKKVMKQSFKTGYQGSNTNLYIKHCCFHSNFQSTRHRYETLPIKSLEQKFLLKESGENGWFQSIFKLRVYVVVKHAMVKYVYFEDYSTNHPYPLPHIADNFMTGPESQSPISCINYIIFHCSNHAAYQTFTPICPPKHHLSTVINTFSYHFKGIEKYGNFLYFYILNA